MAADTLHSSSTTSDEDIPPLISSAQCTAEDSAPSASVRTSPVPTRAAPPVPLTSNALFEIYRRLPLTYSKKNSGSYSSGGFTKQLGSVVYDRHESVRATDVMDSRSNNLIALDTAAENEDGEAMFVSQLVGNMGTVQVNIPPPLHAYMDNNVFNTTTPLQDDEKDDDDTKDKKSATISLTDCIEAFTNREQLSVSESYYCSNCKDHVQAHKQCSVYFAPNVLVVHLKRFYFSSVSHRRDKIEALVDYPVRGLDLRNVVMQQGNLPVADHADTCTDSNGDREKQKQQHHHQSEGTQLPPIYDLQAVSNHYGGLGGGHYTAYAKRDGKWYHFDDSRVTEIENEADVVTSAGYVLYYVRRGVSIPDDLPLQHMNDMNMDTPGGGDNDGMLCTSAMQVHAPNSVMSSMMMEEDDDNAGDYDHHFNSVNPQGDGDDDGGTVLLAEL
uniref:ubiquitinyl hydrolase 1 n=1 Tax=Leptocylindrus danicus TaxID=163516 RepID=A0A7S2K2G4_9STRA